MKSSTIQTEGSSITSLILMVVAIILLTCFTYSKTPTKYQINKDAKEYVTASYNLWNKGIISQDGLKPSQFREPLPIVVLATHMALFTDIPKGLESIDLICKSRYFIKQINNVNLYYIVFALLVMWRLGWQIMQSHRMAFIFIFITWSVFYIQPWYLCRPLPEFCSSALILLIASLTLDLIKAESKKKTYQLSLLIGLVIGLLSLTKAAAFYIGLIYLLIIVLLVNEFHLKTKIKEMLMLLIFLILGFSLVSSPWLLRNKYLIDKEHKINHSNQSITNLVSSRGGSILLGRAKLNNLIANDPIGALYTFSPQYIQRFFFESQLGYKTEDLLEGGKYASLNRNVQFNKNKNDSALKAVQEEKDAVNTSVAVTRILSHLDRHITATAVLIWRGIWSFDGGNHLRPGGTTIFSLIINFYCFLAFLLMPLISLLIKNKQLFVMSLFPSAIFWFYALASHFIPHYSAQLIPVAVLCGLVCLQLTYQELINGKSR